MALSFDQNINVASLVGTWLGSLFTLLGLLAVITQLRSLLKEFSDDREERASNAAGSWASCLKNLRRSDHGVVEGIAPSVTAWIRHYYSNGREIAITPYERRLAGGQASWSGLFARLQIQPQELIRMSGLESTRHGTAWWSRPGQTDLWVDGAKISYGMHGDEFAALLILCGFSPSKFHPSETSSATGPLGYMHLGPHGPFSQVAQLDGSSKALSDLQPEIAGRYVHQVSVQRCIDLALGIFRFRYLGHPRVVVLGQDEIGPAEPFGGTTALERCFKPPSSSRLLVVRRNLTHLTGGEVSQNHLFDLTQTSHFNFVEIIFKEESWQIPFRSGDSLESSPDYFETTMRIAVAIAALKPWGSPAVLPRSLVDALCPLFKASFRDVQNGHPILQQKLCEIPRNMRLDIPGWDWVSLIKAQESLREIKSAHFSGLSSRCALYYDTMFFVFNQNGLDIDSVGIGLAALCVVPYLLSKTTVFTLPPEPGENKSGFEARLRAALRERLNGEPMEEHPSWAYEVLATFLHAWLMDSHPIREDFRTTFRRRVFLG
jgi:hypothetical protein